MINFLKYILFRTVIVIVTLHTIIPHPHSEELTEEKHIELHQKSNSLIGIISIAFHESNDENLDNLIVAEYESANKIDSKHTTPIVSILNSTTTTVVKITTEKIIKCNTNNFNKLLFIKLNRLRGPPYYTQCI